MACHALAWTRDRLQGINTIRCATPIFGVWQKLSCDALLSSFCFRFIEVIDFFLGDIYIVSYLSCRNWVFYNLHICCTIIHMIFLAHLIDSITVLGLQWIKFAFWLSLFQRMLTQRVHLHQLCLANSNHFFTCVHIRNLSLSDKSIKSVFTDSEQSISLWHFYVLLRLRYLPYDYVQFWMTDFFIPSTLICYFWASGRAVPWLDGLGHEWFSTNHTFSSDFKFCNSHFTTFLIHYFYSNIFVALYRLFCCGTNKEHIWDRKR